MTAMKPIKWTIFRVVCYLHMGLALLLAARLIYILWNDAYDPPKFFENTTLAVPFLLWPVILIANCAIGLLLLNRYYPDRVPGYAFSLLSDIVPVLAGILMVIAGAVSIPFFYTADVFKGAYFTAVFVTGVYINWQQGVMQNTIYRNDAAAKSPTP